MPDPRIDIPISVSDLSRTIGHRVLEVRGDGRFILAKRSGDTVTLSIDIAALIQALPKIIGKFQITDTATPPGTYKASTFVRNTTPLPHSSSTMWTQAQLGSTLNDHVYIYNLQEQGKSASEPSQWDLKSNALDNGLEPIVLALFDSIADDGTPVYFMWAPIAENCGQ